MTQLEYHLLDVFTDRPFAGNALAVFVDPPPLAAAEMQALARELNLSETVFVSTPVAGDAWPTRIFTSSVELPFAGHPTVGTAVLLGELGLLGDATSVVLREGVGDVVCALDGNNATFTTASLPEAIDAAAPEDLAAAVGLSVEDLHPAFTAGGYSCGVPFAVIPVRDRAAVARSRVNSAVVAEKIDGTAASQLFVVAPLQGSYTRWHARMYALGFGIAEDPATGSAAAAFAGLLAPLDVTEVTIDQGIEMGRPSRMQVTLGRDDAGALTSVQVGGQAVVVGGGRLVTP